MDYEDPWVDEPDPNEMESAIAAVMAASSTDARQAARRTMEATARKFGLIAGFDVFGPHMVEPMIRVGSVRDPDGEHCSVRIVTGPHAGRSYRIPVDGGPMWQAKLPVEDQLTARMAPHIAESR